MVRRILCMLLLLSLFLPMPLHANAQNAIEFAGVFDLREFDFQSDLARVPIQAMRHMPNTFVSPDHVASPSSQADDTSHTTASYGTYAFTVLLPTNRSLVLSFVNHNFAYRIYGNGELIASLGTVGMTSAETKAIARQYAIALPQNTEEIHFVIHYANFIRPGDRMRSFHLGTLDSTLHDMQRTMLFTSLLLGSTLVGGIVYLGIFIAYRRKKQYLAFSVCCFCLCLHALLTQHVPIALITGGLSGELVARLEYIFFALTVSSFFTYLDAMFDNAYKRMVRLVMYGMNGASIIVFVCTPPAYFTRFRTPYMIVTGMCALCWLISLLRNTRRLSAEAKLLLISLVMMALSFALEAYLLYHVEMVSNTILSQMSVILLVCINMVALSMQIQGLEQSLVHRAENEKALTMANEQLTLINRLKTEFLSTMSHELKTPLSIISGYAQLSEKKLRSLETGEETSEKMRLIIKESNRMSQLITQLLQLSIQAESTASGVCEVRSTLQHIAALFDSVALRKGNHICLELPSQDLAIHMAEDMLVQVVMNLLTNANHYTQDGTLTMAAEAVEGMVRIRITDTGKGIDADIMDTLFDRLSTKGDIACATGLGLHICKEMVQRHGGTICAKNLPQGGACVAFMLPMVSRIS